MHRRIVALILTTCAVANPCHAQPAAQDPAATTNPVPAPATDWRRNVNLDELFTAVRFADEQELTLDAIGDRFPDLDLRVSAARDASQRVFGPSVAAMHDFGRSIIPSWDELIARSRGQLADRLNASPLSRADAEQFLDTTERTLSGDLPGDIVPLLLAFDPEYDADPAAEMPAGHASALRTTVGARIWERPFAVSHPRSWKRLEGDMPDDVLAIFQAKNGCEDVRAIYMATPMLPGSPLPETQDEIAAFIQRLAARTLEANPNAAFLERGDIVVCERPAVWDRWIEESQTPDYSTRTMARLVHFIHGNHYVAARFEARLVTFPPAAPPTQIDLRALFDRYAPVFDQIVASIELGGPSEQN